MAIGRLPNEPRVSIRKPDKDHRAAKRANVEGIQPPNRGTSDAFTNPLRFQTRNGTATTIVDLTVFATGEATRPRAFGAWNGPMKGRPELIAELAPVIKAILEFAAPYTVKGYLTTLRNWWRLFDTVEASAGSAAIAVSSVAQLAPIHRQRAFDDGMPGQSFTDFVRLANWVRQSQGLARLLWDAPSRPQAKRELPPEWSVNAIRAELRRRWSTAVWRWEAADRLLAGAVPGTDEEARLCRNYKLFQEGMATSQTPRPTLAELRGTDDEQTFYQRGYNIGLMNRGFYPDSHDIRAAFHLCLAATGWNPAVLLALDAGTSFIEPHPKDTARYIMRGFKARGGTEQLTEGLYKSERSPGSVILELVKRTAPLRQYLLRELQKRRAIHKALVSRRASDADIAGSLQTIAKLEQGVRSVWLYAPSRTFGDIRVEWLTQHNACVGIIDNKRSYLDELVSALNQNRPKRKQVARLKATDFRDAFAAYAYRVSGGMVLYVMKVLGHRRLATTSAYLDNNVLAGESRRLYRSFGNALWGEIQSTGTVDPTVLAKTSRDGKTTNSQRRRLNQYRALRLSRLGVGCKDPTNPPKSIAPSFVADGKKQCPVHRCTLCVENAVILPESLEGLCMRKAELRFLATHMAIPGFVESSFGAELQNTEIALSQFDAREVEARIGEWERRIATGEHRVVEFDGAI